MKKLLGISFAVILAVIWIATRASSLSAGSGFIGNWSGTETFTINSAMGLPNESGTVDVPLLLVTVDGTLYTVGSYPGGPGLSGKVDGSGLFNGTYLTTGAPGTVAGQFTITGNFSNGYAILTKQPVIPSGQSGVNITFNLNYVGGGPASPGNTVPSLGSSFFEQITSFMSSLTPTQIVALVVAAIAVLGLLGTFLRSIGRTLGRKPYRAASNGIRSEGGSSGASKIILPLKPTYSQPPSAPSPSFDPGSSPRIIDADEGISRIHSSGTGAPAEPINQGRVGPLQYGGQTKFVIGEPGGSGVVEQPDANYTPNIQASWDTLCTTLPRYTDHFFITFTDPPPPGAYFDWKIVR